MWSFLSIIRPLQIPVGSLAQLAGSAKVAYFSKPMMALFNNSIASDLKKGGNIMFIMVSSSRFQVATRVDGG